MLEEIFIDVEYDIVEKVANEISNVLLTPNSPSKLKLGQNVSILFDYTTGQADGVDRVSDTPDRRDDRDVAR